ncbi:ABC transporter substrate-binding protein [Pleomorphochaeta sp. DL1XJH-081]|jgi:NitT/TauT family transport system substrate-binding protein|uniref:ABC transporter substrate-binding protein n=1 Tax=Pleomorphochaeta sp. DL1XJH-081 TaxID=3409690 RepID=UPI003BB7A305
MRKKIVLLVSLVLFIAVMPTLVAQAAQEALAADQVIVDMAVMQGPSGFGTIGLNRNEGRLDDQTRIDLSVYPSPNEVIARLANGELDIAALPTNVAANLYAKGVPVKTAAVVGEGMLLFLTTDKTITELSDLQDRKISIPGSGSTPDQMTKILVSALGFDYESDVQLDYSIASPAQLAQMMIAGKLDLAVLPEPFVTMVLNANEQAVPLLDVQVLWSALTGTGNYPMTVIVVSDGFIAEHSDRLPLVMGAIKDSVEWVNANPGDAGVMIEEAGIMKAAMATPAIPRCNLVFRTATEGYDAMDTYLKVLHGFDYASVGGSVPDESFYLAY